MRRSFLLPLAAVLAFASCDDAAAPEGRAGDVTARVYVDRDASASFTEGDSALAGVTVNLTDEGQTVATTTTGADGTANFADIEPGSYQLSIAGTMPEGTVLVTNPTPAAVVSFQGSDVSVDFRLVFFPGSISGRIYREDNAVAGYQSGADTPGALLWVYLYEMVGGEMGEKIDSVQADGEGAYTFGRVAPGTYMIEFERPSTIQFPGGTMREVTVAPNTPTAGETTTGTFTGALTEPIRVVRQRPVGDTVSIIGSITVPPNTFTSSTGGVNSELWVQDSTGGIALFPLPSATTTLPVGTRVQVVGVRSVNGGQEQIGSFAAVPQITVLPGTAVITPRSISVAAARALTFEGELVRVASLTIATVPAGTGTSYTVIALGPAGDTLQVRIATGTNIPRTTFTVGNRYNITGILTEFNGTPQLKVRSVADVELGQAITPIATARAIDSSSTQTITVVGTVTVPPGRITSSTGFVNSEIWIQDATGGIAVFPVPTADSATIKMGDVVEVTGRVKLNAQQEQIGNFNFIPTVTRLRAGTPVTPIVLTGAQARSLTDEGELITVERFTVTAVGGGTGANFNVDGVAGDGSVIQLRVNGSAAGVTGTGLTRANFTVGQTYSVTGVLSVFNTTVQIKPRQVSDIVPVTTP